VRIFVTILLLTEGLLSGTAPASSAVFSQDEKSVYLVDNQLQIVQLDLASGKSSKPALPKEIHQGHINELGRSNSGNILILQGDDLLAYDPTADKAVLAFSFEKKLSTDGTPEKWSPGDFAYNPMDGSILFFATAGENTSLWYLPKDQELAKPVFIRRVDSLEGMSFSPTGQLFFGYRGDLWCGSIASDPAGAGGKPPEHIYYLNAIRLNPVATLETDEATPSAQGVQVTAAGPERIYLHSLRLGGSGFGTILSVAAPNPTVGMVSSDQNAEDDRSYFDLDKRLELYKAELASAQYYAENGSESFLCISASGKKVFYRGSEKGSEEVGLYLIENNQPPTKVAPDLK
jgi:hypothetical protein